jgi:hypothetical protein
MWGKFLAIALAGILPVFLGLPPDAGMEFTNTGHQDKGPSVDPDGSTTVEGSSGSDPNGFKAENDKGSGFDPDGLNTGTSGHTGTTR